MYLIQVVTRNIHVKVVPKINGDVDFDPSSVFFQIFFAKGCDVISSRIVRTTCSNN